MNENQWNGIGASGLLMHKVQVDGVHMQSVVVQGVLFRVASCARQSYKFVQYLSKSCMAIKT